MLEFELHELDRNLGPLSLRSREFNAQLLLDPLSYRLSDESNVGTPQQPTAETERVGTGNETNDLPTEEDDTTKTCRQVQELLAERVSALEEKEEMMNFARKKMIPL